LPYGDQPVPWLSVAQITKALGGRGVPSIEEAIKEMLLQPLLEAFRESANADMFRRLMRARITQPQTQLDQNHMEEIEKKSADEVSPPSLKSWEE
jgi:hypothetical protein